MIKVSKTKLKGVLLITPSVFRDFRGIYVETYNEELYRRHGIRVKFVQDDFSRSKRRVLRGFHGDSRTWKLINCPMGKFYMVVVNCNKRSKNFGRWISFVLSEKNHHQVLVPPQHGLAHLVLSREAIFQYKQSTYYNPRSQFTYRWDDPRFKVSWPVKRPILSARDKAGRSAEETRMRRRRV